jgi:heme-degrading monooxygenase HmoA
VSFHLAQLNVGLAKGEMDGPIMAGFAAELDRINALADTAPGFVWRLQTEDGDATAIRPYEDERMMVNMSVWESIEELREFVYRSEHVDVMRRRREWFERMKVFMVLWWVPEGQVPSIEEAKQRLAHLQLHGPTPYAFTFKASFPTPDALEATIDDEIGCPA